MGASVVNALSEWLEVEICSDGKTYQQRYERGKVVEKLTVIGTCEPEKTGTKVTFLPDKEIFEDTVYDFNTLKQRLREMAFLTKNIRIVLRDERNQEEPVEKVFHYEGGIREFVKYLNKGKKVYVSGTVQARGYTTNDGHAAASLELTAREVEFLSPKGEAAAEPEKQEAEGYTPVDMEEPPF